jgi:hypothetical protein
MRKWWAFLKFIVVYLVSKKARKDLSDKGHT